MENRTLIDALKEELLEMPARALADRLVECQARALRAERERDKNSKELAKLERALDIVCDLLRSELDSEKLHGCDIITLANATRIAIKEVRTSKEIPF